MASSPTHLLLVGRTGNGKSSTGNSILWKKYFTAYGSNENLISDVKKGSAELDGQPVTVIDGPGIGDANMDNYEEVKTTVDEATTAMAMSPDGLSAIVMVLPYGARFSKADKDTVQMLKAIFGPDVVKCYVIIVMTRGDDFERDTKGQPQDFMKWCKEHTGEFQALLKECKYRCVLFNNKATAVAKLRYQFDSLMAMVKKVQFHSESYTNEQFQDAESSRNALLVKSKLPQLEAETKKILGPINQRLEQHEKCPNRPITNDEAIEMWGLIGERKSFLQAEDKGTGLVVEGLMELVNFAEMKLHSATQGIQEGVAAVNQKGVTINVVGVAEQVEEQKITPGKVLSLAGRIYKCLDCCLSKVEEVTDDD